METVLSMAWPKNDAGAATWRLLLDGPARAAWNMAADETLLLRHAAGQCPPTLRFYSWSPPAVSLGYFQRMEAEIDLDSCRRQGIDIVRRLTGGRAVLHDSEVTYSLVVRENEPYLPCGVEASYLFFSRGIVAGLAHLGIKAQIQAPAAQGAFAGRGRFHSAACFDAPSHYELTVEGRKLVGSAQVRKEGVLLQHGSILLNFQPASVAKIMRVASDTIRERLLEELSQRATGLSDVAKKTFDFSTVAAVVASGIGEQCGIRLRQGEWAAAEIAQIHDTEPKYHSTAWNMRR